MLKELSPIETILDDARQGRMFILVDDEDRENEGDLVIPAQMANTAAVNFMAKHGRGLICLAMTRERIETLGLPLMSPHNQSRHQTAFTISIEAKTGVTTGISAADRARTIEAAIHPASTQADIASPGHVFPLVAKDGGVLVRAGHTEAAVDIARLAGLNPAGVICEIMNDDGSMARLPDLIPFAAQHNLHIATIASLIAYRRRLEKMVERLVETTIESEHGGSWHMIIYANTLHYAEHIALIKGDISGDGPTLVRMHALDPLADLLGDIHTGRANMLQRSMAQIARHGSGVIILLREPVKTAISDQLRARLGKPTIAPTDLRDYGIGAQILIDLGIHHMTLLTNSRRSVIGLEGYELMIGGYETVE